MSIAVFDSGVGGISVLKSLVEVMPNEDFIYYGDSANAPYGTKTLEQVRALTCEHAKDLILNQHAKGLVVACNTATSAAVRILREQYPDVPIVGIEPAVKPAMLLWKSESACDGYTYDYQGGKLKSLWTDTDTWVRLFHCLVLGL